MDKTLVVFSGDLDKAIAAFIIANGVIASGHKASMFFTFWGLKRPWWKRCLAGCSPKGQML